jgi:hypothetical protein
MNEIFRNSLDEFVRSLKMRFSVIPAKAEIKFFQIVMNSLDSGFHRSDDFLVDHQFSPLKDWLIFKAKCEI